MCDHCFINFYILQRWPIAQEEWINVMVVVWRTEEYVSEINTQIDSSDNIYSKS
jgi:hypothetical protein